MSKFLGKMQDLEQHDDRGIWGQLFTQSSQKIGFRAACFQACFAYVSQKKKFYITNQYIYTENVLLLGTIYSVLISFILYL